MKILLVWLFSVLTIAAQPFGTPRDMAWMGRATASGATTWSPSNNPNLFRWWVASDVPLGVTVSNQLLDRIASGKMWQMDTTKSPTNSATGLRFSGAQWLTNDFRTMSVGNLGGSGQGSIFWVLKGDGAAGTELVLGQLSDARGLIVNGGNIQWAAATDAGQIPYPAGSVFDMVVTLTATETIYYTNGIPAHTNAQTAVNTAQYGTMGQANGGFFYKGYVLESGVYSNYVLSPSEVTQLHGYLTNAHGYTP